MSRILERIKKFAIGELELSENLQKKQNVVAICFDKHGKIMSFGTNSFHISSGLQATLAKQAGFDSKIFNHAEISSIAKWRRYSDKNPWAIYIARYSKNKELTMAKPCEICTLCINLAGIKKIFHT